MPCFICIPECDTLIAHATYISDISWVSWCLGSLTSRLFINTLQPGQDGCQFDIRHFQIKVHQWKCFNFDKISLDSVPKGAIDNKSSLVQVMAWRQIGDKPLHEPMMTQFNDAYMCHQASMNSAVSLGKRQRKHQSLTLLALCGVNPPMTGGFPS